MAASQTSRSAAELAASREFDSPQLHFFFLTFSVAFLIAKPQILLYFRFASSNMLLRTCSSRERDSPPAPFAFVFAFFGGPFLTTKP